MMIDEYDVDDRWWWWQRRWQEKMHEVKYSGFLGNNLIPSIRTMIVAVSSSMTMTPWQLTTKSISRFWSGLASLQIENLCRALKLCVVLPERPRLRSVWRHGSVSLHLYVPTWSRTEVRRGMIDQCRSQPDCRDWKNVPIIRTDHSWFKMFNFIWYSGDNTPSLPWPQEKSPAVSLSNFCSLTFPFNFGRTTCLCPPLLSGHMQRCDQCWLCFTVVTASALCVQPQFAT